MKAKTLRKARRHRDDVLHLRRGDSGPAVCGGKADPREVTDVLLLDMPTCTACVAALRAESERVTQALIEMANDVAEHWRHTRQQSHLSALALYDRTTLQLETLERLGVISRAEQ